MKSIRAHFVGKVFIPDEPVSVPPNSKVRILLVDESARPLLDLARAVEPFPDDSTWPADGAAEHDHYLYGTLKQAL